MTRLITIPYNSTIPALSELTIKSQFINHRYTIREIKLTYAINNNNTTQTKIFVSGDDELPITGEPEGTNVFAEYGQRNYITGDAETKSFSHNITVTEKGTWIKIYTKNIDDYTHSINALITIETDTE
uniref:Uncharacterized protein n=1 Tax=viral metagenome TaxID=1070528 RepID=A0A6H1ZWF0_9ZZZZ